MHEGHRDRMRERILLSGIESLQPHEVLEYLLYTQYREKTQTVSRTSLFRNSAVSTRCLTPTTTRFWT